MKESTEKITSMVLESIHSDLISSSDGRIYEGEWENGFKHGKGKEFDPVAKRWKSGIWNKDAFVGAE